MPKCKECYDTLIDYLKGNLSLQQISFLKDKYMGGIIDASYAEISKKCPKLLASYPDRNRQLRS